jgi:DNA uptake protein ComE-like DNA-binding protein
MKRLVYAVFIPIAIAALIVSVQAQTGKPVTIVDANTVSEAELAKLPHMNAALAKSVLAKRAFKTALELDKALGTLTAEQKAELYVKLFVPINLNTATDEEILLIPNLGRRMLREFKEYRPYESLAKFHREIGKYVNDTELARLEQYVSVPQAK